MGKYLARDAIVSMMSKPASAKVAEPPKVEEPPKVDPVNSDDAALDSAVAPAPDTDPVLDATQADTEKDLDKDEEILDNAGSYAATDLALKSVAAMQEWAETGPGDLDEGEGLGDRLFSLLIGIVDDNMDGEISEEEAELLNIAAEHALDYLVSKDIPEEDAVVLLSEFDNDLADTAQELLMAKLPDGDEAAAAEIDAFVFGDGSDESVMDAVYKKRIVVRKGKKVRINKRISGKVRLSAKQKIGIRKMLRKSHSAKAQLRRAKSMRVRSRMSI